MKHHHKWVYSLIFVIALMVVGAIILESPAVHKFISTEAIKGYVQDLGISGYLLFFIVLLLSVPFPIPSLPIIISGGYIYGLVTGTVLTIIATIVGSAVSFYLVRKLGKPFLERFVEKKQINHFTSIFQKRGTWTIAISYALPVFPADEISFILGLTKIKFRTFMIFCIIGTLPRSLILNYFGRNITTGLSLENILLLVVSLAIMLVYIFREKMKIFFFKEIREIEKEAGTVEKEMKNGIKDVEKDIEEEIEGKKNRKSYNYRKR